MPILPSCPVRDLTILFFCVSHTYKDPEFVPTAKRFPLLDHCTLVTESFAPRSYNLVTLLLWADHKYTHDPKPTAKILLADQSTRLR